MTPSSDRGGVTGRTRKHLPEPMRPSQEHGGTGGTVDGVKTAVGAALTFATPAWSRPAPVAFRCRLRESRLDGPMQADPQVVIALTAALADPPHALARAHFLDGDAHSYAAPALAGLFGRLSTGTVDAVLDFMERLPFTPLNAIIEAAFQLVFPNGSHNPPGRWPRSSTSWDHDQGEF